MNKRALFQIGDGQLGPDPPTKRVKLASSLGESTLVLGQMVHGWNISQYQFF
jgi:hypothetical protein